MKAKQDEEARIKAENEAEELRIKKDQEDAAKLKTEEEAVVLLAQISAGADFAEMAKRHSTDSTTNEKGGDLGYFERDHMVPEFNSVVFKMAIGEVSEVVKSDYGYHIIKLNNVVESVLKPFADVKSQLQALHKERIATKELYNLQAELASLAYEEPIDIVADPSAPNAFVEGVMEGKEWVWNNGALVESHIAELRKKFDVKQRQRQSNVEALEFAKFLKNL